MQFVYELQAVGMQLWLLYEQSQISGMGQLLPEDNYDIQCVGHHR